MNLQRAVKSQDLILLSRTLPPILLKGEIKVAGATGDGSQVNNHGGKLCRKATKAELFQSK
jgi:hypothetical protein